MKQKGEIGVKQIIFAVIAILVIAGVLFGGSKAFDKFGFYFGLLDYNQSVGESELSRIGINLEHGDLRYYTGTKWKKISTNQAKFFLNDLEFSPQDLKSEFYNFYTGERKPANFLLSVNHWRKWSISPSTRWGMINIYSYTKIGFEGIDFRGIVEMDYDESFDERENVFILDLESERNPNLIKTVIDWRDQILEGNECEKHMAFSLIVKDGENKKNVNRKYKVKKRFEYIYIDLDEDVSTDNEKWGTSECLGPMSYVDEARDKWINDAKVSLSYEETLSINNPAKVWWDKNNGWSYQSSYTNWKDTLYFERNVLRKLLSTLSGGNLKYFPKYEQLKGKSLHGGLKELTRYGSIDPIPRVTWSAAARKKAEKQKSAFMKLEVNFNKHRDATIYPNGNNVYIESGFSKNEDFQDIWETNEGKALIRKFVYNILHEYNHFSKAPLTKAQLKLIGTGSSGYKSISYEPHISNFENYVSLFDRNTRFTGLRLNKNNLEFISEFDSDWDFQKAQTLDNSLFVKIGSVDFGGQITIDRIPKYGEFSGTSQKDYQILNDALNYIWNDPGLRLNDFYTKGVDIKKHFFGN